LLKILKLRISESFIKLNLQANNEVVRTWGERREELNLKNHVELVQLLGIADLDKGTLLFTSYYFNFVMLNTWELP
jgi:seryl-tRNA synthetase